MIFVACVSDILPPTLSNRQGKFELEGRHGNRIHSCYFIFIIFMLQFPCMYILKMTTWWCPHISGGFLTLFDQLFLFFVNHKLSIMYLERWSLYWSGPQVSVTSEPSVVPDAAHGSGQTRRSLAWRHKVSGGGLTDARRSWFTLPHGTGMTHRMGHPAIKPPETASGLTAQLSTYCLWTCRKLSIP